MYDASLVFFEKIPEGLHVSFSILLVNISNLFEMYIVHKMSACFSELFLQMFVDFIGGAISWSSTRCPDVPPKSFLIS